VHGLKETGTKSQNLHLLPPLTSPSFNQGRGRGEEGGGAHGGGPSWPRGVAGGMHGRPGEGRGRHWVRGNGGGGEPPPGERGTGEEGPARTGKRRNRETLGATMVEAHWRRRSSPEPSTNSSIGDETSVGSTNRRLWDEALDETNAAVPSDSADDARIESNCSPKLLSELEPSRTSASNSGSFGSNLGMGF
jgi:hypothetical protein